MVDGLNLVYSIIPMHLDDDAAVDLLLNWGRGRSQNNQLVRAFAGETGFKTTLPMTLDALSATDDVRLLPITWNERTAVVGVRGETADRDRRSFCSSMARSRIRPRSPRRPTGRPGLSSI